MLEIPQMVISEENEAPGPLEPMINMQNHLNSLANRSNEKRNSLPWNICKSIS